MRKDKPLSPGEFAAPHTSGGKVSPRTPLSRAKQVLFTAILLLLVAGVICGLELGVRAIQARRYGGGTLIPISLRDRFTAWRNNPAYRRVDIQHNAQGFRRTADVSLGKPPGTVRIFLLGGSAPYGAQGAFEHITKKYSRIYNSQLIDAYLEKKLNTLDPSRHWEVINACVAGYRIHQQLALLESQILRYQPDYVFLMDGYNDFMSVFHAAAERPQGEFDIYENTAGKEEFDMLANPGSWRSLVLFSHNWILANSALFRLVENRIPGMIRNPWSRTVSAQESLPNPVKLADLSAAEQQGAATALSNTGTFTHTARQIYRIANLDGVTPIFLLQPILILSHKPFTRDERQMVDYDRTSGGRFYSYLFPEAYAKISLEMAEAARQDGFQFADLSDVFDRASEETFSDFAHLSPAGNEAIAERLTAILQGIRVQQAGARHEGSQRAAK